MNVTLDLPSMPDEVLTALRKRAIKECKPIEDVALNLIVQAVTSINGALPAKPSRHKKGSRK